MLGVRGAASSSGQCRNGSAAAGLLSNLGPRRTRAEGSGQLGRAAHGDAPRVGGAQPLGVRLGVGELLLRLELGLDAGDVAGHLGLDARLVPARAGATISAAARAPLDAAARGLDGDAGAAREHVVEVQRSLVRGGVQRLDLEVLLGAGERLVERAVVSARAKSSCTSEP